MAIVDALHLVSLRDAAFSAARQTSLVAEVHDRFGASYEDILKDPEARAAYLLTVLERHPELANAWKDEGVKFRELLREKPPVIR